MATATVEETTGRVEEARRKPGRPVGSSTGRRRDERIQVPATAAYVDFVRDMARREGRTMAGLVRHALASHAQSIGQPVPNHEA